MSNDHHRQWCRPADIHGRLFPGQACCGPGNSHRYLASGRRGQRFGSRRLAQHDPRLVRRDPRVRVSACLLHCRIKPYWIEAAALRAAARRRPPPGSASEGPPGTCAPPRNKRDPWNVRPFATKPGRGEPLSSLSIFPIAVTESRAPGGVATRSASLTRDTPTAHRAWQL